MRFVKNKTTTIVEKSFKAFSFSIGTAGPHNIAIVKGWNKIGLEVDQKKGFRNNHDRLGWWFIVKAPGRSLQDLDKKWRHEHWY